LAIPIEILPFLARKGPKIAFFGPERAKKCYFLIGFAQIIELLGHSN
jgi:hypothetical protein